MYLVNSASTLGLMLKEQVVERIRALLKSAGVIGVCANVPISFNAQTPAEIGHRNLPGRMDIEVRRKVAADSDTTVEGADELRRIQIAFVWDIVKQFGWAVSQSTVESHQVDADQKPGKS